MPASRHAWLRAHHTENPFDRSLTRPLTIVGSEDIEVTYQPPGSAQPITTLACSKHDFIFPYRTVLNEERIGRGRLFVPPACDDAPKPRTVPLILSIHYEGDQGWASGFLAQGWACMTPIALGEDHAGNLAGEGMDHTLAMAELARRLKFVDLQRIGWTGGSAGGYQCLMTLESLWPVACANADVPISDLNYNIMYLKTMNRYNRGITDPAGLVIPVVQAVQSIVEKTERYLKDDVDAYWQNSVPVGASLIRSPTIIHSATGDLLCPVAQIGDDCYRPPIRGDFPPGWSMDYRKYANSHALDKPLVEWFPPEDVEHISVAIPDSAPRVDRIPVPPNRPEQPVPRPPLAMKKPFSRTNLITILTQDEGEPTPFCAHSKYAVWMDTVPYFAFHFARGFVPPEHLRPEVLTRLLGRFSKAVPQNPTLPPIRRLHEHFDRWETLLALETFVGTPARKENVDMLARTYAELPPVAKALDVDQDGILGSFAENPVAGVLFHQACELRKSGETGAAEARESRLKAEFATSPFAKLKTA
jgi:hypothetical protein